MQTTKGFLAGLGIAGKVALGASLAAAATTGAGAAGVLPKPLQHAVATTVSTITPFEFPDGGSPGGSGGSDSSGSFERTLPLPAEVNGERATSEFKIGVLRITLPKRENAKARSHKIKVSDGA